MPKFWLKVLGRLLAQSGWALAGAVAYTIWKSIKNPSLDWTQRLELLGIGYFGAMWLVGQFGRVAKNLTDASELSSIRTGVDQIRAAVLAQNAPPVSTEVPAERVEREGHGRTDDDGVEANLRDEASRVLLEEARANVAAGNNFSGLLTASVAFERAVRAAVQRLYGQGQRSMGLLHDLKLLGRFVPEGVVGELHNLRKARNSLVHGNSEASQATTERVWHGFLWGVAYLDSLEAHPPDGALERAQ